MREVINTVTASSGGGTFAAAATGQFAIAVATFILFVAFGAWGAYWKYRDSKAIREALDDGDLPKALKIRGK